MRLPTLLLGLAAAAPLGAQHTVSVAVDPSSPARPISPLIYGFNHDFRDWKGATLRRWGGNSTETYNWENNANNAGHDNAHSNSRWQARHVPVDRISEPAAGISVFHEESLRRGVPSLVNVPVAGFVAADADGPIAPGDEPPSRRWKRVVFEKPGPYSLEPDTADGVVYVDEMVAYLRNRFGPADGPRGIRYWSIGNEPGLWSTTHPMIHREKTRVRDYVARAIAAARAVKKADPSALVVGPSSFGIYEYATFCQAPDWPEVKAAGGYHWFLDYFLDEFRKASEADGRRLLDVLTLQIYLEGEVPSVGGLLGVIHGPRIFWDPAYRDASWIGEIMTGFTPVIPLCQASITRYFPGTGLGFTEFDRGMVDEWPGGLALAELLGTFGARGVELATHWPLTGFEGEQPARYGVAAYRLFRDADGAGLRFGDRSVPAVLSDDRAASAYAALDSEKGTLHVVLLNKNLHARNTVRLALPEGWSPVAVRGFDEQGPDLTARDLPVPAAPGLWTLEQPRRSAYHLVFKAR